MVNSVSDALNAFLAIWSSLPQPVLAFSASVIVLWVFRVVFEVVAGH